jgi:hypothetical protein
MEIFESLVLPDELLYGVTTHLQFDISTNALEIRAVQSPKCVV